MIGSFHHARWLAMTTPTTPRRTPCPQWFADSPYSRGAARQAVVSGVSFGLRKTIAAAIPSVGGITLLGNFVGGVCVGIVHFASDKLIRSVERLCGLKEIRVRSDKALPADAPASYKAELKNNKQVAEARRQKIFILSFTCSAVATRAMGLPDSTLVDMLRGAATGAAADLIHKGYTATFLDSTGRSWLGRMDPKEIGRREVLIRLLAGVGLGFMAHGVDMIIAASFDDPESDHATWTKAAIGSPMRLYLGWFLVRNLMMKVLPTDWDNPSSVPGTPAPGSRPHAASVENAPPLTLDELRTNTNRTHGARTTEELGTTEGSSETGSPAAGEASGSVRVYDSQRDAADGAAPAAAQAAASVVATPLPADRPAAEPASRTTRTRTVTRLPKIRPPVVGTPAVLPAQPAAVRTPAVSSARSAAIDTPAIPPTKLDFAATPAAHTQPPSAT